MKRVALSLLLATAGSIVPAAEIGAKSEVREAIRTLANQPNYSWTSTIKSEDSAGVPRVGPAEGQTEKGGDTYFRLKIGNDVIEAAFRGNASAIKAESDWESADEMKGDREWIARRLKTFQVPVAEAEDLLAKTGFLRKEPGGLYSADLTAAGVRDLLTSRSRTAGKTAGPRNTKGWVKFWVMNGVLARYEYNAQGKVIGSDLQEHDVNRTTAVEVKNVGKSKVQLPEGAKKKLTQRP